MIYIFTILFLLISNLSGTVYAQECTQPSCFQQKDKELTGLAATTSAPSIVPYFIDADGNMATTPFTALGRSMVGASTPAEVTAILGVVGGAAHIIEEEGNPLTQRSNLNFTGAGVTATDAGGKTVITIPGGGAGHVIQEEGSDLPAQPSLNFTGTGMTCTNNAGTSTTDCAVTGGHTIQDEGKGLPQQPSLNLVGAGVSCANNAGNSSTDCTIATGAEGDPVVGAVNGIVKSNGAASFSAATADVDFARADADTKALADNSTAGFWAAATNAARSFANGTGIAWTNPAGVAGNPQANVTSTVVMTDRSSTWTTGDVNLRLASSFSLPNATGAAPTTPATCAFDLTSQTYKCGLTNGSTVTLATTILLSAYQPLHANLTALSGVTGASAKIPYFTGAGAMDVSQVPLCVNSGGNVLHVSSQSPLTFTCDASASGLSGATNNYGLFATGATTFASSDALQLDGSSNVWAKNGLVVGDCTTDCLSLNTSSVTGGKAWTVMNFDGTVRVSTGAFTAGNVITTDANGLLIDGGAAGAGTWTDTSVSVGTHKTIDSEGTSNVITTVSYISLAAGGCNNTTPSEAWDLPTSGGAGVVCSGTTTTLGSLAFADGSTQAATNHWKLHPYWVGAVDIDLVWWANSSTANSVRWSVSIGCVGDGQAINVGPSYNAASASNTAYTGTAGQRKTTSFTGVTMTDCAAGETAFIRVERIGADGGDDLAVDANLVEVGIKLRHT